jgi:hypothetical protein
MYLPRKAVDSPRTRAHASFARSACLQRQSTDGAQAASQAAFLFADDAQRVASGCAPQAHAGELLPEHSVDAVLFHVRRRGNFGLQEREGDAIRNVSRGPRRRSYAGHMPPERPAPTDPAIPATPAPDTGPPGTLMFSGGVAPAASTAAHDPASTGAVWFVTGRVRASCAIPGAAAEVAGEKLCGAASPRASRCRATTGDRLPGAAAGRRHHSRR